MKRRLKILEYIAVFIALAYMPLDKYAAFRKRIPSKKLSVLGVKMHRFDVLEGT